jgi:hypothetical protein
MVRVLLLFFGMEFEARDLARSVKPTNNGGF